MASLFHRDRGTTWLTGATASSASRPIDGAPRQAVGRQAGLHGERTIVRSTTRIPQRRPRPHSPPRFQDPDGAG
jgi:hypothetical protein